MAARQLAGAIALGLALAVAVANPAAARTTMTAYLNGTDGYVVPFVEATIDDATFTGPNCLDVPVQARIYGGGTVELTATRRGSSASTYEYLQSSREWDSSGSIKDVFVSGSLLVCPNIDGAGDYSVKGQFSSGGETADLTDGRFAVDKAWAYMESLEALQDGNQLNLTGEVLADTGTRSIGFRTLVTVRVLLWKKNGVERWRRLGSTYSDRYGQFSFSDTVSRNLRGKEITATSSGSAWVTATASGTDIS